MSINKPLDKGPALLVQHIPHAQPSPDEPSSLFIYIFGLLMVELLANFYKVNHLICLLYSPT